MKICVLTAMLLPVCILNSLASEPRTPATRPITKVKEYDDVRFKDMKQIDLSSQPGLPATLSFNQNTVWPASMPAGVNPEKILSDAMNPGLGVRALHAQGITGKGVNVAIIDQPLFQDHPEFAGKIVAYHDVGCGSDNSMHGPAVASLLVGSNCGTAPGARLYFVAAPSWKSDAAYYAKAMDWVVAQNDKLLPASKIRVVSVSAAPSGAGSPFTKNADMWEAACQRAEKADILVLDCTSHRGFISPCYLDGDDPESPAQWKPGFPGMRGRMPVEDLLVPCSPRTVAEEYRKGEFRYQYWGRGGLSWGIPYAAGILALGWEIRPDLGPAQMRKLLFQSAYQLPDGSKVINPAEFIRLAKAAVKTTETLVSPSPASGPATQPVR